MSKHANPKLIGAFVLGAVALLILGIGTFGSGNFFKKTISYVMYFKGSVSGLLVGAPVTFRGVKVGSVESISLALDPKGRAIDIPVVVAIEPERIRNRMASEVSSAKETIELLVKQGLRAQLAMQSIVTGLLYVELEFHPEAPPTKVTKNGRHPRLPTVQSELARLANTLKKLPLEDLVTKTSNTLAGLERFVNAPEMTGTLRSLNSASQNLSGLIEDTRPHLKQVIVGLDQTVRETNQLVRNINARIGGLSASYAGIATDAGVLLKKANTALDTLTTTLNTTQSTISGLDSLLGKDSPTSFQLNRVLRELSDAARSIRLMADYLEQHPNALIYGRQKLKGK